MRMPPLTLEGLVGLEADDLLERLVDVAGAVGRDTRDDLGVHVKDAAVLALLLEEVHDLVPELRGGFSGAGEERGVALVGGVVLLDEITDVNLAIPVALSEALPFLMLHYAVTLPFVSNGGDSACYRMSPPGRGDVPNMTPGRRRARVRAGSGLARCRFDVQSTWKRSPHSLAGTVSYYKMLWSNRRTTASCNAVNLSYLF